MDATAMSARDAYTLLGLPYASPAHEVRAAYRRLVRRWHPDHNGASVQATVLTQVSAAYLKTTQKHSLWFDLQLVCGCLWLACARSEGPSAVLCGVPFDRMQSGHGPTEQATEPVF